MRFLGRDNEKAGLRVDVAEAEREYRLGEVREMWEEHRPHHQRYSAYLLLVRTGSSEEGWLCGDWGGDSSGRIVRDGFSRLLAVCERALLEEQNLVLWDRLDAAFDALGKDSWGDISRRREAVLSLRHDELFSRHYISKRAWDEAERREDSLRELLAGLRGLGGQEQEEGGADAFPDGRALLARLGFEVAQGSKDGGKDGGKDKAREVLLRAGEQVRDRAFGLVLRAERGESFRFPIEGLGEAGESAEQYALREASRRGLPFAVIVAGGVMRLYVRRGFGESLGEGDAVGTGEFSSTRFLESDVRLATLLWLHGEGDKERGDEAERGLRSLAMLFSAAALADGRGLAGGCLLGALLKASRSYVDSVAERLRDRIYKEAMPRLAEALARARGIYQPNREELDETYKMAMTVLFRLLFVSYAEDRDLIPSAEEKQEEKQEQKQRAPFQTQEAYAKRSLKSKALELSQALERETEFGKASEKYWGEVNLLFDSIDKGDPQMGLPAYNGGLFRKQKWEQNITLSDDVFAPILQKILLYDGSEEGVGAEARGPLDFTDLSVRELGTIYEGLLESELSRAAEDLTIEGEKTEAGKQSKKRDRGLYRPMKGAKKGSEVLVAAGNIYVHNTSGERKATGSYYTPDFCVEHLLDGALEPAMAAHFARLDGLEKIGSEMFFDFRVADIAMGSGHFLVAAAERMAKRFTAYYGKNKERLREVTEDLERLGNTATKGLRDVRASVPRSLRDAGEREEMLLRRRVVGSCLYGVDRNALAVQLARVSLWIHSFVPGLPLSYLDRNLVCGDSLVGVGTMAEIEEKVRAEGAMFKATAEEFLGDARESLRLLSGNLQASVAEVKAAEAADKAIEEVLKPTQAFCDVMMAVRINPQQPNVHSSRWQKEKENLFASQRHREAERTIEGLQPIHFPVAFPEVFLRERQGFDVILGNPPWENLVFKEDQFWTRYIAGLNGYPQATRERLKAQWREERPDLVALRDEENKKYTLTRKMLQASSFGEKGKGLGSGDPDLYKVFAWRYWQLLITQGGRLGVVMPRSLLKSKGSQDFRRTIFSQSLSVETTTILNNNGWCFADLHPQFAVTLLTLNKNSEPTDTKIYLRGPYNNRENFDKRIGEVADVFKGAEISTWSEAAALPSLPTAESPAVFQQLRLSPSLNHDDGKTWRARPYTDLHGTHDKPLMDMTSEQQPEGTWLVYKGESFDLWQADRGTYYAWAQAQPILDMLQKKRLRGVNNRNSPFSEFSKKYIERPETLSCLSPRLAFRDITNATNSRTMICCLIPPKVFCANSAPYFLFPRGDERDQTYLLGMLCSRPLDWYARRFVELHMNHHVINSLPIPRPVESDPLRLRVIQLAGRLACQDARLHPWASSIDVPYGNPITEPEKTAMTCEIDALAAHLYGLSRAQLTHIFATFHEGWLYQETLERTLAHYDSWSDNLSSSS